MIFLVPSLSLIFALWVFFDSQKHGFSFGRGLLWSILVFLGWIISLPLYLMVRKKKGRIFAKDRDKASPPGVYICFYCRQSYTGDLKICPNCGQNLMRG